MKLGDSELAYIAMIGAQTIVGFVFFSVYHSVQLATAQKFKHHTTRSIFWAAVFFVTLPILFSPLIIGAVAIEGASQEAFASHQHPLWLIPAVLISLAFAWFASFYPKREKLRQIGAWGVPEGGDV